MLYHAMLTAEKMPLRVLERIFSWHPSVNNSNFANNFRWGVSKKTGGQVF
jgi:hypothetical protein